MNSKGQRSPDDGVRIVDPEGLRVALWAVEESCGGVRQTAKRLGLSDSTLLRLLSGEAEGSMSLGTYSRIKGALEGDEFESGLIESFESAVEVADRTSPEDLYQRWLDAEMARLEPAVRPLFEEVSSHPTYERLFLDHQEKLTGKREMPASDRKRQWLAVYRTLEPFAAADPTLGAEAGWMDLHAAAWLRGYLRDALHNERILLRREGDASSTVFESPPVELATDSAGVGEPLHEEGRESAVPSEYWDAVFEELERERRSERRARSRA